MLTYIVINVTSDTFSKKQIQGLIILTIAWNTVFPHYLLGR